MRQDQPRALRNDGGALVAALLLLPALAAGQTPSGVEGDVDGHARMLAELAAIRERTPAENLYLGDASLRALRAQAESAQTWSVLERVQWHRALGNWEVRLGDLEAAVVELEAARALVEREPALQSTRLALLLAYDLGVAYMRLGETENCVARHTSNSCILPIRGDGVHAEKRGSASAIRLFEEVLAQGGQGDPAVPCARWLLNIAHMTLGAYPGEIPAEHLIPLTVFGAEVGFPRFEDVAPAVGLDTIDLAGGAVCEDFDGDGRLDVMTTTWDTSGPMRLFVADGAGGFLERTEEAGLTGLVGGLGLSHADYDGDGDVDALVLRGAWLPGQRGAHPNSLLANDGHGAFTDVTFAAGLGERFAPSQAAAWADFDEDGDLDLFIGNESTARARVPSELFRNAGDGTFEDVASTAGVTNMRFAKGATFGDFDGDGHTDLYVSNLRGWNRLYMNEGEGTFADRASAAGVLSPYDSFATWSWDFDNDGAEDLFAASYFQSSLEASHDAFRLFPVVAEYLEAGSSGVEGARLYRNDGKGGFEDLSEAYGIARHVMTMGANFGDIDNDGWLDLYLGTGYPHLDGLIPNVMLRNRSGGGFEDVTLAGGFGHLQKGHGVVFADLDADGDQDVFEQMGGGYPQDAFGNVLFENPGMGRHWVKLDLVGADANPFAVGARIELSVTDGDQRRRIHRTVSSGGSFGGNPFTLHVGLGDAERVDRLVIRWPGGGGEEVLEELPVDRRITIHQGRGTFRAAVEVPTPFRRR